MVLQGKKAIVTSARYADLTSVEFAETNFTSAKSVEVKTPISAKTTKATAKSPENARPYSAMLQPAQIEKPVYLKQKVSAVRFADCKDKHYKNEKEDITLNHLFEQ